MLPSTAPPGLLEAVAAGYRLAWRRRRRLLAAQLPIVAVLLAGHALLDLAQGHDRAVLIDGVLTPSGGGSPLSVARVVLEALIVLFTVLAGAVALTTGRTAGSLLIDAARKLRVVAIGITIVTGAALVILWLLPNRFGVVLFLAVAGLGSARLLLEPIAPHPAWRAAGSVLVGAAGLTLPLGYVLGLFTVHPLLEAPARALLLVVVAAGLAGVLAVHRTGTTDTAESSGNPGYATVAVILALLVAPGLAIVNPTGAPVVRTHESVPGAAPAIAWPAGGHPVIVTTTGVRFCDTDRCDRFTTRTGGPAVWENSGAAGIGPDGAVVRAALTGGVSDGGPFVHFARCTRDGCREAWVPVRASAREKLVDEGGFELAAGAAPDGSLWFFLARPERERYRMTLIRCPDATCAQPQRHDLGTVVRTPDDGYPDGRRARLVLAADGRPRAALWLGHSIVEITCAPVTCAGRTMSAAGSDAPSPLWTAVPVTSLQHNLLRYGDTEVFLDAVPEAAALAVAGDVVHVTGAVPATRDGLSITFGATPEFHRQMLWRCARSVCRATGLDSYPGPPRPSALAAGPDGRVLIVREDRLLLVG